MAAAIDNSLLEGIKIVEERNLYTHLREYCKILKRIRDFQIVVSDYALEETHYVFVVYSGKNWERIFCEEFAMEVRNKYSQSVSNNWGQECAWLNTVVIPDSFVCMVYNSLRTQMCKKLTNASSYN